MYPDQFELDSIGHIVSKMEMYKASDVMEILDILKCNGFELRMTSGKLFISKDGKTEFCKFIGNWEDGYLHFGTGLLKALEKLGYEIS